MKKKIPFSVTALLYRPDFDPNEKQDETVIGPWVSPDAKIPDPEPGAD